MMVQELPLPMLEYNSTIYNTIRCNLGKYLLAIDFYVLINDFESLIGFLIY